VHGWSNDHDKYTKRRGMSGTNFWLWTFFFKCNGWDFRAKRVNFFSTNYIYIHTFLQNGVNMINYWHGKFPNEFSLMHYGKIKISEKKLDLWGTSSWCTGAIFDIFLDIFLNFFSIFAISCTGRVLFVWNFYWIFIMLFRIYVQNFRTLGAIMHELLP